MSKGKKSKRKNNNTLRKILRKIRQVTWNTSRRAVRGLVRDVMALKRHRLPQAGFVLPTVTMVMLVVILLTIAISLRSFDRADQARNVRVNQALLATATPALDRARSKLEELLATNPPTTDTPTDDALYLELTDLTSDKFTFGDETRLQVSYDISEPGGIQADGADGEASTIEDNETTTTAWRFPVDTDNNGKFDSFTVYGIFFRSPERNDDGSFKWAKTPLDARTPPMPPVKASTSKICEAAAGTSASLVGDSGWYKSDGKLKKSFFVYTATVPITDAEELGFNGDTDYENFKGRTGVAALEYQQDWSRIPLTNNAVVYEDDLEIAPSGDFRLNGRVFTNSNLLISPTGTGTIRLYLVSSEDSCFYDEENSAIIVGGNVINGSTGQTNSSDRVFAHLMHGDGTPTLEQASAGETDYNQISSTNQTVASGETAQDVAYDTAAFTSRVNALADTAESNVAASEDPQQVKDSIEDGEDRKIALRTYFKSVARRVPHAEPDCLEIQRDGDGNVTDSCIGVEDIEEELRPADSLQNTLVIPTNSDTGVEKKLLNATDPTQKEDGEQNMIGDRVLVGSNLPQKWWFIPEGQTEGQFVTSETLTDKFWQNPDGTDSTNTRERASRVEVIPDVGSVDRDGFWEREAATEPEAALDGIGGLRIVTGAGVYERINSFLPPPAADDPSTTENESLYGGVFPIVWPDTMPMSPARGMKLYDNDDGRWVELTEAEWDALFTPEASDLTDTIDPRTSKYAKGDLRMRATVLYHYAYDPGSNPTTGNAADHQEPIACISSYYDPSDENSASNYSDNGKVYGVPAQTDREVGSVSLDADGLLDTSDTGVLGDLVAQANMVFPDGRFVNERLREALLQDYGERTLAEQAAVDSTLCAFGILQEPSSSKTLVPSGATFTAIDGAIKEVAFLDPRQIKAVDDDDTSTLDIDETFTIVDADNPGTTDASANLTKNNDLPLEERQPLEIRATQIDLEVLREATIDFGIGVSGPTISETELKEYLLPFSGIIYASRDDALPDISDRDSTFGDTANSPNDLKLDPTRRPNGIMLINGRQLARGDAAKSYSTTEDVIKEKGLILVSNNPVYIQGDFNLHTQEEFTDNLTDDWSNFYTDNGAGRTEDELNSDFACRKDDPRFAASGGCDGDDWRAATVLSDSITLLSKTWKAGYRNHGDFDLRNNAGNGTVVGYDADGDEVTAREARLFNGFFANDYAINGLTADWSFPSSTSEIQDDDYSNSANDSDAINSSYFNNFQTPVQRRTTFPEYLMEMCRKASVSECTPEDWVVGYDLNNDGDGEDATNDPDSTSPNLDVNEDGKVDSNDIEGNIKAHQMRDDEDNLLISDYDIQRLLSGSTSYLGSTQLQQRNQRYPHRVAFKRNIYGQLELEHPDAKFLPIPMGIEDGNTSERKPTDSPYSGSTIGYMTNDLKRPSKALWFRTTTRKIDPSAPDRISYANDRPLFYVDPSDLASSSPYSDFADTEIDPDEWYLPKTPLVSTTNLYDLGSGNDYALCVGDKDAIEDTQYEISPSSDTTDCTVPTDVTNFVSNLTNTTNLPTDSYNGTITWDNADSVVIDAINWDDETNDITDDGGSSVADGVMVLDLGATIGDSSDVKTITLAGDRDTIFVLRASSDVIFDTGGVRMLLKGGVNPNNIFWVFDENYDVTFGSGPDQLTGNFIGDGNNSNLTIGENTNLLGVRLLGFDELTQTDSSTNTITAMTSQAQPLLVPVLQIHQPTGDATAGGGSVPSNNNLSAADNTQWIMRAHKSTDPETTTMNLMAATGDVPSDPDNTQSNGGLQNLVRFIENWQKPCNNCNLHTSEIQGGFIQLGRSKFATAPLQQASGSTTSTLFGYPQRYSIGTGDAKHGTFSPPNRQWGFDVGILSQSPDLFAQKFTLPSSDSKPNEFFREVSRDDDWIKGLLCAKVASDTDKKAVNRPDAGDSGYYCSDYE